MRTYGRVLFACAVAFATIACGDDEGDDASAVADVTDTVPRTIAAPAAPTDGEIAHIAMTANTVSAAAAQIATVRSPDPDVVRFAGVLIADHAALGELLAEVIARQNVTAVEHAISGGLERSASEARTRLDSIDVASFDRAYLEREVAHHEALIELLDQRLIQSAQDAELETLLRRMRPAVEAHLRRARQLLREAGG